MQEYQLLATLNNIRHESENRFMTPFARLNDIIWVQLDQTDPQCMGGSERSRSVCMLLKETKDVLSNFS